jgi:hypothetical protein
MTLKDSNFAERKLRYEWHDGEEKAKGKAAATTAKKDSLFEGSVSVSYRKQRKSRGTNSGTNCQPTVPDGSPLVTYYK